MKICASGFIPSKAENEWCGSGVYFYDVKSKAWWSANRTVREKMKRGQSVKPAIIMADIINISKDNIFDLRIPDSCKKLTALIDEIQEDGGLEFLGCTEEEEKIELRAKLIEFYCNEHNVKLLIGTFRQKSRSEVKEAVAVAEMLGLVTGAETIFCAKDTSIISNIRRGGEHSNDIGR